VDNAQERQSVSRSDVQGAFLNAYKGYSKLRTRTVLGSYGRTIPRSIGPH
jgi:hypothetical protein